MGKDFELMINDQKRKLNFIEVFGSNIVNIESPIPKWIKTPNGQERLAYFLDLELISLEEKEKLIKNISKRFNQEETFVRENLNKIGVPILKENTTLIMKNPQRWF